MLRVIWPPAPASDTPLPDRQALLAIIGLSLLSWALFITIWIRLTAFLTDAGPWWARLIAGPVIAS
jgi:hypothetical protein